MKKLLWIILWISAASVYAQTVNVTVSGTISITGVPRVYNAQYVLQKTDFGFLWLDTGGMVGGLVQVQAKCGVGQPPANTNIYVLGDCNGITNVSTSGNSVLARQFNGQCGAATLGCGGEDFDGHYNFLFRLGTWEYLGYDQPDIPDSTQTTDLLGRTWNVAQITPFDNRHFQWSVVTAPTGTPTKTRTPTRTPTVNPSFTATPTKTPTVTPTGTITPPTNTPTITPTNTRTPFPTLPPTLTFTPTPTGDIVECATVSPDPVIQSTRMIAHNCSWRASTTTINSVDWVVKPGACQIPTPNYFNQKLPSSFFPMNGIANLPAPNIPGFFCLYLRFHYTPGIGGTPSTRRYDVVFATN